MSNLYLYNYNNYFNRIVKKESSLANYGTPIYSITGTNFDMNDSVEASHVVNYGGFDGDYVVITDNKGNITSRWFVMENTRNRGGQHTLKLRRDLIVDNYDKIINAPALINRAMVNYDNPLIFNEEGFSFNQIKKGELLLKDGIGIPWYYIYMPKNAVAKSGIISQSQIIPDYEVNTAIDSSPYAKGKRYSDFANSSFKVNCAQVKYPWDWLSSTNLHYTQIALNNFTAEDSQNFGVNDNFIWFDNDMSDILTAIYNEFNNATTITGLNNALKLYLNLTPSLDMRAIYSNNKIVKDSNNKYYQMVVKKYTKKGDFYTGDVDTNSMFVYMKSLIENTSLTVRGTNYGDYCFRVEYTYYEYDIDYIELKPDSITWTVDFSNHAKVNDGDYNILCLPADTIYGYINNTLYEFNKETSMTILNGIIKEYGNTVIYDIQLLPYQPGFITYLPSTQVQLYIDDIDSLRYEVFSNKGIIFYLDSISCNSRIILRDLISNLPAYQQQIIPLEELNHYLDLYMYIYDLDSVTQVNGNPDYNQRAIMYKFSNECDKYRICSPNYNGLFEFNVAKNGGSVETIDVNMTLRPYNPYIHLVPNFKGLYGDNFDDCRGLICQGDFSIPIITDQFKTYEYQNKNYENIFNRQIQHMDFEYSKARTEALFGATVGTIGAGISGGVTGGMIGGGVGAVAGAGIGTIASAIGGAVDYNILKQRQAENKDLAIENYKYQLGNIKALPYTLNKITPFTENNKIWPFIEYYTCTDEEKMMLANKIKYNSMNCNKIDKIINVLQPNKKHYLNASLIRLEDLDCQMHEAQEIYNEILKGVFI